VHPVVAEAMTGVLAGTFGNPSSVHSFGQAAKAVLDNARIDVAHLLGAEPAEVVFTSGGTEADNFALRGVAEAFEGGKRRQIVTTAIEHEAVLNTVKALGRRGWTITILPVGSSGVLDIEAVAEAVGDQTALVSVMHANNEVGTIQPIVEAALIARDRGALFHTDAVQTVGKLPIDVRRTGAHLLSLSAHKFGGPKGVGAIWIHRGTKLMPLLSGGRHERNRRAGTENVAGIAGLGAAARVARQKLAAGDSTPSQLRDRLEQGILAAVPGTAVNGDAARRVPNTTNVSFEGVEAEALLIGLDLEGIAVSTGSACSSGTLEPSHVLRAMGLRAARAQSSIRFSLGDGNDEAQIDRVLAVLPGVVSKLRQLTRV
jgi:cysteine desulfurase